MISPADQKIIQVELTNACPFRCSNCTRFVGHHKTPFFMDIPTFQKAIDSLKDYPGMVGIMGGEPTIHPDFAEMVKYARESRQDALKMPGMRYHPQADFGAYARENTGSLTGRKLGLWSSLGPGYYQNYEQIQNSFGYQCLNDHKHQGEHLALLLTRKELGISDADWPGYRDNCWVQKEWSASITPKGAFFCEVAAALDMLYGGPGGWPIEPGWWKRTPDQFGDQLSWCELCSACLPVPRAIAKDSMDYASPIHIGRLDAVESPKMAAGRVIKIDPKDYQKGKYSVNHSCEPYLDPQNSGSCRISQDNKSLKPKNLKIVTVCVNYDDYLRITLPRNMKQLDSRSEMIVVTDAQDLKTQELARENGARLVISERIHALKAPFAKGKAINDAFAIVDPQDWILVMDSDILLQPGMIDKLFDMTLNPGAMHYTRRWGPEKIEQIETFLSDFDAGVCLKNLFDKHANQEVAEITRRKGNAIECFAFGYFQLFNKNAESLKGRARIYEEKYATAEMDDHIFGNFVFSSDKRCKLPVFDFDVIHLPHGMYTQNWAGRVSQRISEAIK